MSEEFKLPGSSYAEVSKIIQGYATIGKAASLNEVSKAIGMDPTSISRNSGFLVSVGILEPGKTKGPTEIGRSLGNALIHDQTSEIKRLWREVIINSEFMKSIVSAIRIRKGMDDGALRSHIAYSAGAKKGANTTAGCGTIIEILKISETIAESDGKYIVSSLSQSSTEAASSASAGSGTEYPIQSASPKTNTIAQVSGGVSPRADSGGLAIQINIEVHCDADDLDTLGTKIRKIIDDINEPQLSSKANLHADDDDEATE